ncbi:NAD(P)-dependent dehydrogenase, short-chain alcohol dehydrogenase family [Pseudomonas sp. 43mfcvi1.1]|uniref:SDR family NAD(P)-dependent oxidoreductase n=1 Tax=Pseudomonas sp. 43mfcvi1.1 TaxID=1761894 RepID=UPI000D6DACF3|nr:SDR family oxidoreductase [Pseudomonas sp. 43mfcvi1.1]PWJ38855.1 NAD(P)-dependent dehydrogenase (short-subunit alcohol dehydrogenase family) [Pseudomonas sp. 43mfcvi1.1]SSB96119.1 NAD(P)-dependent dehydrogenase, short-chain alcohol dehydrogenase family [Pseudomonas sp. 43mfcvi1.1]
MSHEFKPALSVVTGASSGIGLAVTQRLLERGSNVIAMSRQIGGLGELVERFGDRLSWLPGDVTQASDQARLAQLAASIGPVDCLIPNAGIAQLADGLDLAAFDRQWAVNGAGALNTLSSLREHLSAQASVVFIGTFLERVTFPGLAAYIASKAALRAQMRTLAVELAPLGVRINMVSPGPTATPIWGTLGLNEEALGSVASTVNQRLLNGQFLEPGAVADVILFQLSQGTRGVYGQDWVVDSGYTLR